MIDIEPMLDAEEVLMLRGAAKIDDVSIEALASCAAVTEAKRMLGIQRSGDLEEWRQSHALPTLVPSSMVAFGAESGMVARLRIAPARCFAWNDKHERIEVWITGFRIDETGETFISNDGREWRNVEIVTAGAQERRYVPFHEGKEADGGRTRK